MEKIIQFIEENDKWKALEDYIRRIRYFTHEHNLVIENCKAMIESIYKTILVEVQGRAESDFSNYNMGKLNKEAIDVLQLRGSEYVKVLGSFADSISRMRNDLGETAHGRSIHALSEKRNALSDHEIRFIIAMTDNIAFFLLNYYTNLYPRYIKTLTLEYEDNQEFNEWFDENEPAVTVRDVDVSPSKVLFDYDDDAYKEYLQDYQQTNYFIEQLSISSDAAIAVRTVLKLTQINDFSMPQLKRIKNAFIENEQVRLAAKQGAVRRFFNETVAANTDLFSQDEMAQFLIYYNDGAA